MSKPTPQQAYKRAWSFSACDNRPTTTPLLRAGEAPRHRTPDVMYTTEAWQTIRYIVAQCSAEVGWLGLVEYYAESNVYLITDIFVPPQEVTGVTTEIESDAMAELANKLLDQDIDTSKLYYWGHSHVNMGVSPSTQDERQLDEYLEHCPVFIRGIYNKKGDSKVDVFDTNEGVVFQCVDNYPTHDVMPDELVASLKNTLKKNVTERRFLPQTHYGNKNFFTGQTTTASKAQAKAKAEAQDLAAGFISYDDYLFRDEAEINDYLSNWSAT